MANPRQRKMAELMAVGMTAVDAYKEAGYKGSAQKNAFHITENDGFSEYMAELRRESRTGSVATRSQILEGLTKMFDDTEKSAGDRIRAAAEINKMEGHYSPDKSEVTVNQVGEMVARIRNGSAQRSRRN